MAIQQALEAAVDDLLPTSVKLVKAPSVYAQRREVEIMINEAVDREQLAAAYFDLTGYRLDVQIAATDAAEMVKIAAPSAGRAPIEINGAYRMIREALEPHGLQKVGLRHGQLMLTFISPEVGMRQAAMIEQLADATGYTLILHPHPDQRAILHIVNHELRSAGWLMRKGPGLHTERHEIVVHLHSNPAETEYKRVAAAIEAQTGYQLHIKSDVVAHEH